MVVVVCQSVSFLCVVGEMRPAGARGACFA